MTSKYIYLVGTYDEYGTSSLRATLERDKVPKLIEELSQQWIEAKRHSVLADALNSLPRAFSKVDLDGEIRDGHTLGTAWGGLIFYATLIE